ncbi:hypothetical protein FHS40_008127 [Streptomyces spectabilis]|uniref:HTH gntR-type domain-containing protein n=2 Tax=Streptomyces spectabilis TaxID=68270 RepID=A0A7W8EYK7_STRST|nr:hypothetical protein [Streptomyces spectabilis]
MTVERLPNFLLRGLTPLEHRLVMALYEELRNEAKIAPGHIISYPGLPLRFRWASHYGVSSAMWLLKDDGLAETVPRLGTRFVIEGQTWEVPRSDLCIPLRAYVGRVIRERIIDGTYPAHEKIPPARLLADEFGVSLATLHSGIMPLFREGLLKRDAHGHSIAHTQAPTGGVQPGCAPHITRRGELTTEYAAWGQSKTLTQWSRDPRCLVTYACLKSRVLYQNWPLKRALSTPARTRAGAG